MTNSIINRSFDDLEQTYHLLDTAVAKMPGPTEPPGPAPASGS